MIRIIFPFSSTKKKTRLSHVGTLRPGPCGTRKPGILFVLCFSYRTFWEFVDHIATKYRHDCLSIRVSSTMEEYPICELQYYEHGKEKRFIRSMKDEPKWEFYQKGKQLTFEKPDHYNKRRIKDRFNEELLLEYLHALGWDIRKNTFWETEKPYYKA